MTNSDRVLARPSPELWDLDELMSLPEAVRLFWPDGPLTVNSLRVAIRDGTLPVAIVAGKHLTTRRAVLEMSACRPLVGGRERHPASGVGTEGSVSDVGTVIAAIREGRRGKRKPGSR